jgi:hypothetical protein
MKFPKTRIVFIIILLVMVIWVSFWYSPYHQVRSVVTVVDINAPGDRVWQVLTDLDGYRAWNPFLTSASGAITPGSTITIAAKVGNRTITFHPRISAVEPKKKLAWVGRLLSSEFFEGNHEFEVIELDQSRTRVIQSEHFKGMLVAALWGRFSPALLQGFRAMNDALKRRCEQIVATQP